MKQKRHEKKYIETFIIFISWARCCFYSPPPGLGKAGSRCRLGLRCQDGNDGKLLLLCSFLRLSLGLLERKKTEREGTECVILKWRILVNISLATAQRKTPSVSMVTGTPPCSPLCGREEAPASERACKTDRRPAVVDIMNRCIM